LAYSPGILVGCVTEHEYGERGSAGDREMGGKTERREAQVTDRREGR
jgi:hypothetical protein